MRAILRLVLVAGVLAALGGTGIAFPAPETTVTLAPGSAATLTMGTYAGVSYGTAKELVYYSDSSLSDYVMSELQWPLQPAFYWGTRIALRLRSTVLASVDLRSGIPGPVGYMQDSDYLNFDSAHTRTHFSQQDGYLEHSLALRADLGWSLPANGPFLLTPFLRYAYLDIEWSARNGYIQYPPQPIPSPYYTPWSASEPKSNIYGMVAIFQQVYTIPAVGIDGTYHVNPLLSIGAKVAFSPIASINDVDNHLLRYIIFYDSMSACTYVESKISVSFRPSPVFELSLDLSYLDVSSPQDGTIIIEDTLTGTPIPASQTGSTAGGSTAGGSIQTYSANFGVHLRI